MKITADDSAIAIPGDFGDVDADRTLHVSPQYFSVFRAIGARTAEALYDQAVENPQRIARELNWSAEQVSHAIEDLHSEIEEVRPDYFQQKLAPASHFGRGAMPPRKKN